jgi:hypothetical protein
LAFITAAEYYLERRNQTSAHSETQKMSSEPEFLIPISDCSRLAGVTVQTIHKMANTELIDIIDGRPLGVNIVNAFVACLAATYRKQDIGWKYVAPMCLNLKVMSERELVAKFNDAFTLLVVVPDKVPAFAREGDAIPYYNAMIIPLLRHWHQFRRTLLAYLANAKAGVLDEQQPA